MISSIAASRAIDLFRKRSRDRRQQEVYQEDLGCWGDDVSDYAFTSRGARRRIAAKEIVSEEQKPFQPWVTRRAAAAARGHLMTAVTGLPEKIRRPLLLAAEGKTCVEISRVVGIVPSTAWKQANKAKATVLASLRDRAGCAACARSAGPPAGCSKLPGRVGCADGKKHRFLTVTGGG